MDETDENGRRRPIPSVQARLDTLALQHYGYADRAELIAAGLTTTAITYRSRTGRLHKRHHDVYAIGYPRLEPIALAAAAVLAGGRTAALSFGSAGALWKMQRVWPDPPEVSVLTDHRQPGIRWHRVKRFGPGEVTVHKGIRTTSAARTLLDLAPRLGPSALTRMINDARIKRVAGEDELQALCARHRTRPGATRILQALGAGPTRSALEDRFPVFARRHGLPPYRVNARIAGLEVDIVFDAERVIVELDGWEFHRGHGQFTTDRARDAITLAAGYVTVRLTAAMLAPRAQAATANRLLGILQRRRRELGSLT